MSSHRTLIMVSHFYFWHVFIHIKLFLSQILSLVPRKFFDFQHCILVFKSSINDCMDDCCRRPELRTNAKAYWQNYNYNQSQSSSTSQFHPNNSGLHKYTLCPWLHSIQFNSMLKSRTNVGNTLRLSESHLMADSFLSVWPFIQVI